MFCVLYHHIAVIIKQDVVLVPQTHKFCMMPCGRLSRPGVHHCTCHGASRRIWFDVTVLHHARQAEVTLCACQAMMTQMLGYSQR